MTSTSSTSFEILGARQSLTTKSQAARDAARALAKGHGSIGKPVYVLESGSTASIRADSASPYDAITPVLRVSSAGRRSFQGSAAAQEPTTTTNSTTSTSTSAHTTSTTSTSRSCRPTSAPAVQSYITAQAPISSTSRVTPSSGLHVSNGMGSVTVPGTQGTSSSSLRLGPVASSRERPMSPLHRVASMREVSSMRGWPGSSQSSGPVRPNSASAAGANGHLAIRRSWSLGSQPRASSSLVAAGGPGGTGRGSDDGQNMIITPRTEELLASMFKHLDLDASRAGVPAVTSGVVGSVATVNAPGKVVAGRSTVLAVGGARASAAPKVSYGPLFPGDQEQQQVARAGGSSSSSSGSGGSGTGARSQQPQSTASQPAQPAAPSTQAGSRTATPPEAITAVTVAATVTDSSSNSSSGSLAQKTPASVAARALTVTTTKVDASSTQASVPSPSTAHPLASPDVPSSTPGDAWAIRTVLGNKKGTASQASTSTAATASTAPAQPQIHAPSSPTHSKPTSASTSTPSTLTTSPTTSTAATIATSSTSTSGTSSTGSRKSNLTLDMSKIRSPFADHGPAKALSKVSAAQPHIHTTVTAMAVSPASSSSSSSVPASPPLKTAGRTATSPSAKVSQSPKAAALESTASPAAFAAIISQRADHESNAVASPGLRLITGHGAGRIMAGSIQGRSPAASHRKYNPSEPQPPAISEQEMKTLLGQIPGAAALPHRSCEVVFELLSEASQLSDTLGLDSSWITAITHHCSPVRLSFE